MRREAEARREPDPTDDEMGGATPGGESDVTGELSEDSGGSRDSEAEARMAFLTTRVGGLKTKAAGKRRKEKRGKLLNFRRVL